jgi:HEAT repeat protein/beta-lactamase regulating signal transducer with metallopeptidase domain
MLTSTLEFMDAIPPFVIDALFKATILLAAATLAGYLLRRKSAALRHLLWTLAIVGMVALPVLTPLVPFRLHVLPAAAPRQEILRDHPVAQDDKTASAPHAGGSELLAQHDASRRPTQGDSAATIGPARVLLIVWATGVLLLLARFALGFAIVRRISGRSRVLTDESWHSLADRAARSLDVRTPVDLRISDDVAMPFACGLLKPTIVLPTSSSEWTAERREAVLMHEFAHISRGDLALNTLSHFVRAAYWFHPLAWLAAYRLRVEGERACDDAVLRAGALPSDYAEHLLSIVRTVGNTVPNVALAMARRSDFEGRLLAILEPGVPRGRMTRWRAAGMAALFLVLVMPLAAMSPSRAPAVTADAKEQEKEEEPRPASMQEAAGAASALIEALNDASAAVRIAAVNSLGKYQNPAVITALAKALREDTDARVREAAAYALGEIDDPRAVTPLIEALKSERAANVREKIVRALGEIDDPSAVSGIAAVLKDPSVNVRRAAVWALGELEDANAVSALSSMVRDEDIEVRKHVAEALGQLENPSALDALATLSRDADPEVRASAVSSLGSLEDLRSLPTLTAALKDASPHVRSHAADAIGSLDNLRSAPRALIDALADSDREVRKEAAETLGSIGDEAAVPGLKRLTTDVDVEVRRTAAEALSDIGGVEAVQALMGMLKDSDPEIRRIAAEALGKRRDR